MEKVRIKLHPGTRLEMNGQCTDYGAEVEVAEDVAKALVPKSADYLTAPSAAPV